MVPQAAASNDPGGPKVFVHNLRVIEEANSAPVNKHPRHAQKIEQGRGNEDTEDPFAQRSPAVADGHVAHLDMPSGTRHPTWGLQAV